MSTTRVPSLQHDPRMTSTEETTPMTSTTPQPASSTPDGDRMIEIVWDEDTQGDFADACRAWEARQAAAELADTKDQA
jgi:hypothetical protein